DDGKNTMATQLLDRLREAIISGQLEAGSKINLSRVRDSLEVSLSPLREALETMALRQAMTVGDVDWEGDVMRALHRLNRTVRDPAHPETLEQWEARHREFHLTLIAGCRMPVLLNFCRVLLNLNDRYRRSFL